MKHTTANGEEIEIKDMTDRHLINTCNFIKKIALEGVRIEYGGCGCTADEMWYDCECLQGDAALKHLGYKNYHKEMVKRGLYERDKI